MIEMLGSAVFEGKGNEPLLTVLNYSGGQQSTCLLEMVLRDELEIPENFVVLNADPGMENSETYKHVSAMRERCELHNIHFETVEGPNLYSDILASVAEGWSRVDNPPYWTKAESGKRGRLRQKCTQVYKIAPMDRAIRRILNKRFGISLETRRPGVNIVEKWIGFAYDEVSRIKPSDKQYIYFKYPLIDRKMRKEDVKNYFFDRQIKTPPRSVCNACFANGLDFLRDMYLNRPMDWEQAVRIDNAIRDWGSVNVKDEVYVSATLQSLVDLAKADFILEGEDMDKWSCDSGYCFT